MKTLSKILVTLGAGAAIVCGPAAQAADSGTVSAKGATVAVANESGTALAAIDGGTVLSLEGSGFQAIKGGAGGIYVVFGWVSSDSSVSWAPSNGGVTGEDYRYAPDSEDETNKGYSRFVAFEGSKTASAANGGLVAEDGTWSTELTIPAATFESVDRNGDPTTVDCQKDTCGVITIGAHGVKNANNETFTPIEFVQDPSVQASPIPADDTATSSEPAETQSAEPEETATSSEDSAATSAESPADSSEHEGDSDGGANLPLIIGGVVVVIAAIAAVIAKGKRKQS